MSGDGEPAKERPVKRELPPKTGGSGPPSDGRDGAGKGGKGRAVDGKGRTIKRGK